MIDPYKSIHILQFNGAKQVSVGGYVIVEAPVSLTVNGKIWMSFMCTPTHLEALAVGFLFNERIIDSIDEISSVRVCESNDNVDVWLTKSTPEPSSWRRTSGCAGGMTAVESIERPSYIGISEELKLHVSQIEILLHQLYHSQSLYSEAGGVHTSILSDGKQTIFSVDDIGRHNTLDKIAGLCLLKDTWPSRRMLVTTGRISSEMLQKTARLGVKIIISRTSPTSISIELAEAWGITLLGYARADRFLLYTCPDSIIHY
jgi:FdhD protein